MKSKIFIILSVYIFRVAGIIMAAENNSYVFGLESPLTGKISGPFVLQENYKVETPSGKYLVHLSPNGFLQLKDEHNKIVSEPYEFTEGRMIRIDGVLYTIIDIKEIPFVQPLPLPDVPESKSVNRNEKKEISPAIATVPAVAVVKNEYRRNEKLPTSNTANVKSSYSNVAMWKEPEHRRKVSYKQPAPMVTSRYAKPESVNNAYFSTGQNSVAPVKQSKLPAYYTAPSATASYNPEPKEGPTILRPYKGVPFSKRLGVAVDVSLLEKVKYNYKLSNGGGSTDSEVSRNTLALKVRITPLVLEFGKVFRADWSGNVDNPALPFNNVDLGKGSGWYINIKYRYPLWKNDRWLLAATAGGGYRTEDYELSYGEWKSSQVTVPGTNGEDVVQVVRELAYTTKNATFTEKTFALGFLSVYKGDIWHFWGGVDFLAYHSADIESEISTSQGSYTIDVDRKTPYILSFGSSVKKLGVNWFASVNLAGENAIRLGVDYKF